MGSVPMTQRRISAIFRIGTDGEDVVWDSDERIMTAKTHGGVCYIVYKLSKNGYYAVDKKTGRLLGKARRSKSEQVMDQLNHNAVYIGDANLNYKLSKMMGNIFFGKRR